MNESPAPELSRTVALSAQALAFMLPILAPLIIFEFAVSPEQLAHRSYFLISISAFAIGFNLILSGVESLMLNRRDDQAPHKKRSYLKIILKLLPGFGLFMMSLLAIRFSAYEAIFWALIIFMTLQPLEKKFTRSGNSIARLILGLITNSLLTITVLLLMGHTWVIPGAIFGLGIGSLSLVLKNSMELDYKQAYNFKARLSLAVALILFPTLMGFLAISNLLGLIFLLCLLTLGSALKIISALDLRNRSPLVIKQDLSFRMILHSVIACYSLIGAALIQRLL